MMWKFVETSIKNNHYFATLLDVVPNGVHGPKSNCWLSGFHSKSKSNTAVRKRSFYSIAKPFGARATFYTRLLRRDTA